MENLDFGNIAIATVIVGVLNLAIVVLTKTETILKIVERIKGVVGLDYRNRAKRSDDEIRISKKHAQVARERVRHSFITMELWNCRWTWNWSDSFEPINIKGYCLGDVGINSDNLRLFFRCNHPVEVFYLKPEKDFYGREIKSGFRKFGIFCSQEGESPHKQMRAEFDVSKDIAENNQPEELFQPIILKRILSERDLRIAKEIKKLRLQFWR